MPRQVFSFDPPDRFVAGTVGQPGDRTFYLQASRGGRTVSVALEKQQVGVLADRMEELLDEVRRRLGDGSVVPAADDPVVRALTDVAPLEQPVDEEFRVGTMGLAWDGGDSRVVLEAQGQPRPGQEQPEPLSQEAGDPAGDGPDLLRVRLGAAAARAFVERANRVIAAGRPPCPLCGLPLDPAGHICPKLNGHRH